MDQTGPDRANKGRSKPRLQNEVQCELLLRKEVETEIPNDRLGWGW